jgi:hypothetical protein
MTIAFFCKIVVGQMPCFKLLEDDETLSFIDIYPANDGIVSLSRRSATPHFSTSATRRLPPSRVVSEGSHGQFSAHYRQQA